MPAQYDTIQEPYDEFRKCPIALIERANVQDAVSPFIRDASVLELACGSGFYSTAFLEWGAKSVVGVDISSKMVEAARAAASHLSSNGATISFKVADCTTPTLHEDGPFDLVFGAWLLNYAANRQEMVDMFRNIALNLKDGGHFVGVTPPPTQDPILAFETETKARPNGSGGLFITVTEAVEDGLGLHAHVDTQKGNVDFDVYHLKQEVYEASAREGGLGGKITWSVTAVPDEFLRDHADGDDDSAKELESYKVVPHYGIVVIAK
ncbi:MAG: hypothetical protein Q9163_003804 [Psora crenata]